MDFEPLRNRFFAGTTRYRWLEDLGYGGNAVVFKAHDDELDEVVAIKVMAPDLTADVKTQLLRFKREIHLNRQIKHRNVARLFEFGMSGDYRFITMEFVPGTSLERAIHDRGVIPPHETVAILRQICLGTEAAHELGIIHRDLKSSNVMVNDSGAVVILDFGLARGLVPDNVTLDSVVLGTPQYMSPEQALGKDVDARSDLYSIGVIGYEALTGQLPFNGRSPMDIVVKVLFEPPPFAELEKVPGATPELTEVVKKAMARNAKDRFQSVGEFERALEALRLLPPGETPSLETVAARSEAAVTPDLELVLDAFLAHVPNLSTLTPRVPFHVRPMRTAEPPAPDAGELPSLDLEPPAAPAPPARERGPDDRPVVLVVDPEGGTRKEEEGILTQNGCETVSVASGPEALEMLMKKPIDLVLMDVKLPGMDGFDVARVIKAQPHFAAVPVLLMAPSLDRNKFAFGIQSGATDVLGKPIPAAALSWRVWQILKRRGFRHPAERAAQRSAMDAAREADEA